MNQSLLFSALATTIAMATAFAYLFVRTREPFLLYWLAGSIIWIARYLAGIIGVANPSGATADVVPLLSVVRSVVMFWGARSLMKRPLHVPPTMAVAGGLLLALFIAGKLGSDLFRTIAVLCLGVSLVYAGVALGRERRFARTERLVTEWALVALGVSQLIYPLTGRFSWMPVVGFGTSATLQTIIAVGILVTFLRSRMQEAQRLAEQRSLALTRVLSDFVSICAHCKSIRNELGDWQSAQQYVTDHTAVALDVRLCPTCAGDTT